MIITTQGKRVVFETSKETLEVVFGPGRDLSLVRLSSPTTVCETTCPTKYLQWKCYRQHIYGDSILTVFVRIPGVTETKFQLRIPPSENKLEIIEE